MAPSSIPAIIRHPFVETFNWLYWVLQLVLSYVFAPVPPPPEASSTSLDTPRQRVAVIGAGLTGVSSAAHCVGHGFDVQIFESRSQDKGLGGIWSVRIWQVLFLNRKLMAFRGSIRHLHSRSIASCTDSTRLSNTIVPIQPRPR